MSGVNAVIHFGALITFFWLVYYLNTLQKHREFLRTLLLQRNSKIIHIEWPTRFVKQLADTIGLSYMDETTRSSKATGPKPINISTVAEFVKQFKIIKMVLKSSESEPEQFLEIYLSQGSYIEKDWPFQLSKALGMDIYISEIDSNDPKELNRT